MARLMKRKPLRRTVIRQLRSDEERPAGEPKRYLNARGYVRLRWKVAPGEYVEVYEHRLVAGMPEGKHVHHEDEWKANNENLKPLTPAEHRAEHREVDDSVVAELYLKGWSTPRIARKFKVEASTIWRSLRRSKTPTRDPFAANVQRMEIAQQVFALYREGKSVSEIAVALNVSETPVRRIMKAAGLIRPPGRPTGPTRTTRREVRERSGGRCEARVPGVCTGKAQHMHHVVRRSQKGNHLASNLRDVCLACHEYIHAHPAWAMQNGLLVSGHAKL